MSARIELDKRQVISLYHSGMNMRQVAEELGVSNSDICQFMIKHNINVRSSSSQKVILDKEQVASMYESGLSQSKIGKALGVSNACISKLMKRYDIKTRKTGRGRPKKIGIKNE
jgi:transposase